MLHKVEVSLLDGGEISFSQFHTTLLAEVDELFQKKKANRVEANGP